jgi:hypothetical protein
MKPLPPLPRLFGIGLLSSFLLGCSGSPDAPDPLPVLTGPDFASAGAGPPREGSGTGLVTGLEILSSRNAGSNVIQERRLTGTVQGTLEGTFVEHVRGVIHGNGLVTFQGTMEFTGTLADCGTGTLTLGLTGRGQAGAPVTEATVQPIRRGSNTLAASGTGTVSQVGPNMTYEIRYVCR